MKKRISALIIVLGLFALLSTTTVLHAQAKYKVASAEVNFFAGTPVEDIDGTSDKLLGVIDSAKNSFAFRIPMNSFIFKRELMQEHYNENYLETEKYPNSSFKGKLNGDVNWEKAGSYEVTATGTFDVHNVTKEYSIPATITIKDGKAHIDCTFMIKLEDHNIDRPKIVLMKIAEEAKVTISADLEKL